MERITVRGEARVEGPPDDTDAVIRAAMSAALEDAAAKARADAERRGLRLGAIVERSEWHQGYNPDHPRLRCTLGWPDDLGRAENARPWTVDGYFDVTFEVEPHI